MIKVYTLIVCIGLATSSFAQSKDTIIYDLGVTMSLNKTNVNHVKSELPLNNFYPGYGFSYGLFIKKRLIDTSVFQMELAVNHDVKFFSLLDQTNGNVEYKLHSVNLPIRGHFFLDDCQMFNLFVALSPTFNMKGFGVNLKSGTRQNLTYGFEEGSLKPVELSGEIGLGYGANNFEIRLIQSFGFQNTTSEDFNLRLRTIQLNVALGLHNIASEKNWLFNK